MGTTEEAIAVIRSRGFPAIPFDYPTSGTIRASAREITVGSDYHGEGIELHQHTFLIFPKGRFWIVRDCNWLRDIDEQFGSLDEAVSAILTDFDEWLAVCGKSKRPGLIRSKRHDVPHKSPWAASARMRHSSGSS